MSRHMTKVNESWNRHNYVDEVDLRLKTIHDQIDDMLDEVTAILRGQLGRENVCLVYCAMLKKGFEHSLIYLSEREEHQELYKLLRSTQLALREYSWPFDAWPYNKPDQDDQQSASND